MPNSDPPLQGTYRPSHPFDNRVVQRYIREGYVSQEEYQAHLDSLEDCAGKYDLVDPLGDGELAAARTYAPVESRNEEDD
ncbi:hypothetical protein L6R50_02265 [Myxococcota bacterium]|nr:hypothetical protein [Myxococcota bacterium]